MSKTNCNDKKGQSFKAVENFLRRIAYNLGNSPSQTEVKIVSCIPIDVTDLQKRIFQLQTELADCKCAKKEPTQTVGCTVCAKRNDKAPTQVCCNECLLTTTSVLSVYCPGHHSFSNLRSGSSALTSPPDPPDTPDYTVASEKPTTEKQSKSKHLFSKKKKECKNRNLKTQLIYHAYADSNTPFRHRHKVNFQQCPNATEHRRREILDPSYLAGVVHRQYQHNPYLEDSNLSDISSPVCRDDTMFPCGNLSHSKSDVCSCCHGQFQNVDNYMVNRNRPNIFATSEYTQNHELMYHNIHNSNDYDEIPVKEKSAKNVNNYEIQEAYKYNKKKNAKEIENHTSKYIEKQKKKEIKKPSIKCWPGKTRLKYRNMSTVVNYCSLPPHRTERGKYPRASADKWRASTPRVAREDIEYSPVYPKPEKKRTKRRHVPTKRVHHAATSSPGSVNMANRQTVTTITDETLADDKTETTLNQIKDILQSVLTEVKTSGKTMSPPELPKKDVVVQNAPAPAARGYEYGASRLLQSYTYSPYNMHMNQYNVNRMPYKPSCSHPLTANNYTTGHTYSEYPGVPTIPVQQYPLLIQPQKHLCNSYYGNNNRTIVKHATSAATNTEQSKEHSKETERLIKEIYKSIALNIEESSKDNSVLEYMKAKSITDKYVNITKSESDTESVRVAKAISEIFKNTNMQESTATGTTGSNNSYEDEQKSGKVSESRGHKTERVYAQKETPKYLNEKSDRKPHHHHSTEESSDNTVINEESEETSSESVTDDAVEVKKEPAKTVTAQPVMVKEQPKVAQPKKEKSGLFKKMLKIFQPRPRRRHDRRYSVTNDSEPTSESDSDDYQTIYSQKVAETTPKKQVTIRSRPHSKVFYVKQPQHRSRPAARSPERHNRTAAPHAVKIEIDDKYKRYREQKRREEHMYENHRNSNRYPTRGTGDRERRHYAYYQNYEARPVLVHHNYRISSQAPVAPPTQHYTPNWTPYSPHGVNFNLSDEIYPYAPARVHTSPARPGKPYYVASRSNAKRGLFSKAIKKTKIHCGRCGQDWKDLIING